MKKSGFTLVELLAIIVVLAIIALLAVQAVLPTLDKAKRQLFATEGQRAIEAAETYLITNSVTGANGFPTRGERCVSIETLIGEGYFDAKKGNYRGGVIVKNNSEQGSGNLANNGQFMYVILMTDGNYIMESFNGVTVDNVYDLSMLDGSEKIFGKDVKNLSREEKLEFVFNDFCKSHSRQ